MLKVLLYILSLLGERSTEQIRTDLGNTQKIIYYGLLGFCLTLLCVSLGFSLVKAIAMTKNGENNKK